VARPAAHPQDDNRWLPSSSGALRALSFAPEQIGKTQANGAKEARLEETAAIRRRCAAKVVTSEAAIHRMIPDEGRKACGGGKAILSLFWSEPPFGATRKFGRQRLKANESCELCPQVSFSLAFSGWEEKEQDTRAGEIHMFRKSLLTLTLGLVVGASMFLPATEARADHFRPERHERRVIVERHDRPVIIERHDRPVVIVSSPLNRLVWTYQGGFFKDVGSGRWEEFNASGHYCFQEVARNADYIDLFDGSRGFTVRLYNNAMFLQGGSYACFTKFYDGSWTA
jgi:hypothetical protein